MDSDQRAMRHMKLPERGTLRVTGVHEGHSHSKISGVITAQGIRPTRVEHRVDGNGRCAIGQDLPVLVDQADPSRFAILWDEAATGAGSPPPSPYGPGAGFPSTAVGMGPDGQPIAPQDIAARIEAALDQAFAQRGRQVPPNVAARVEQALDRLAQAGPQNEAISEAIHQALGRASGQPYGAAGGQWGAPPSGPDAAGFPQVSWTGQEASGAGFNPAQPAHPRASGGELASAIVLAAQDVAPTPGFAAPGAEVDLTLEVRRADGSIYTAHTRLSVPTPERRAAVATPGTRLTVLIDPNDPARVEIDTYGQF
jgi:hypothetical protein